MAVQLVPALQQAFSRWLIIRKWTFTGGDFVEMPAELLTMIKEVSVNTQIYATIPYNMIFPLLGAGPCYFPAASHTTINNLTYLENQYGRNGIGTSLN